MVKKKTRSKYKGVSTSGPQYTVEQLVARAETCMDSYDFELAEKFYSKALEMDQRNCDLMEVLGELLVDLGKVDKAKELFNKSIAIAPNIPSKYMNLGQLLEGEQAIANFRKGIALMLEYRQKLSQKKSSTIEIDEELSAAYCSLAEVYLTDACYNSEAEQECQQALDNALQHTPNSPEVFYLLASFRVSQQRNEEALEAVTRAYSFWKNVPSDSDSSSTPFKDPEYLPPYQLRFNTAKLFVELGKYQTAIEIFEALVAEEDCIAEVWHSLGLAYQGINDLHATHECLSTALKLFKQAGDFEEEVIDSVTTLLAKMDEDIANEDDEMEEDAPDDAE